MSLSELFRGKKEETLTEGRSYGVAGLMALEHGKDDPPATPVGTVTRASDGGRVSVFLVPDAGGLSYACRCSWDGREVRVPVGSTRKDGDPWFETAMGISRDLAGSRRAG